MVGYYYYVFGCFLSTINQLISLECCRKKNANPVLTKTIAVIVARVIEATKPDTISCYTGKSV